MTEEDFRRILREELARHEEEKEEGFKAVRDMFEKIKKEFVAFRNKQ